MLLNPVDLPEGEAICADVCIVGAGAAGITIALALLDSGIDVLLLESGGLAYEADSQSLYEGEVADERMHSPPDRYRQRRFGGSTTIWGGRCIPFDAIDFEARDWIDHSGWPFPLDELLPDYAEANRLCEAGPFAYRVGEAFDRPMRPMIAGFVSPDFSTDRLERSSCPTDFGARYGHRLMAAANIRVVLHANVIAIQLDTAGTTVEAVTVATPAGTRRVTAKRFVIATGGLEVARLLLASDDVRPEGIGNEHDVVGRYYMCHVAGVIGSVEFSGPLDSVWHGYDVDDDGIYVRRRIALEPDAQRRHRLGNFIVRLHHPRITDPSHRTGILSLLNLARAFVPYEYGKRLHGEEQTSITTWLRHARNVVLDLPGTVAFLWNWLRKRTLADRKLPSVIVHPKVNRYSIDFHAEQEPNRDSRVTLGKEKDRFGMPKLHVDWRYTARDVETVKGGLALLARAIQSSGVGTLEYEPDQVEFEMTRYGAYGGHHIGTARMGNDPATSVVNAQGRVHGIENLYIAGSAVFPTSSQANPTLTIVALSLRLARHLKALVATSHASSMESGRREKACAVRDDEALDARPVAAL